MPSSRLVLLDIGLPKLNGLDACRRIPRNRGAGIMLTVALYRLGAGRRPSKAEEAGFDAHLGKPVDFEALKSLLAAAPRR